MRLNCSSFGLAVSLLALHAHAEKILLPLHISHFEAATGLQRRELDYFSDFYPQPQTQLTYGLEDGEDKIDFANVTFYATDGLPIVVLERLDHLIEYVDCNQNDGQMTLAFRSRDAFERAVNAWEFVDDEEDLRFLLITNHDGCSPVGSRQPHIVTGLGRDSDFLTIHLTFHEVDFSQIMEEFEMSWGQYERRRASTQARNWPRDVPKDTSASPVGTNEIDLGAKSNLDTNQNAGELGKGKDDVWANIRGFLRNPWPKTPAGLSEDDKPPDVAPGIINSEPNFDRSWPAYLRKDYDYVWSNKGSPYAVHIETKLNEQQRILRNRRGNVKVTVTDGLLNGRLVFTLKGARRGLKFAGGSLTVILQHFESHGILSFQRDGDNHAEEINDKLPGEIKVSEDLDLIVLPTEFGLVFPWARFGLTVAYSFGFDLAFLGTVDLAVEWWLTIDDGQVIFDMGGNNHQVVAFVRYKPVGLEVRKLTANAELEIRGKLSLFFGFKILGVEAEVTVFTPAPGIRIVFKPSKYKGGLCKEKGIDTGIITEHEYEVKGKVGFAIGVGWGETTIGDEPFTPNLIKNPKEIGCMAVPLGVLSDEGEAPDPGVKVPGKQPAAAPAGKKEEDKQETPCNDNNDDGKTCPAKTSELQTKGQGASPDDPLQPDGSTTSLQSAAQLDAFKPTDPGVSSPENGDDSTSTAFLPPAGQSEFSPTNDYTASLQPGPLADLLSSGDQTASLGPQPDQSLSENSKASLPPGSLADQSLSENSKASLPPDSLPDSLSSGNTPSPQPADPLASPPSILPFSDNTPSPQPADSLAFPPPILPSSGNTPSPEPADQFASLPSMLPFVS